MAVQIQLRRGTASQWTSTNPTLAAGEIAIETDTSKLKLGDGSTAWTSLAYFSAGSGDITGVDITAGDGLDISQSGTTSGDYTATVSADLKANGGLVIESTEIALKLDASNITGTLAIADGGTGATAAAMIGVITAVDAAAAQDVLGGTTVGKAVFVAADAAAARTAIGAGTGAGDLVASNNLSELTATAATARTNLELGTAALVATGTGDADAILGNDARLTDDRDPNDHSTDKLTSGTLGVARGGTGLTSVSTLLNSNTTKSDVGLGSVENTALTTWAGSGNITTVGAITGGTWGGTAIDYSALSNAPVLGTAAALDVGTNGDSAVQLTGHPAGTGALPAVSGAALTSLNASNVSSGNLADAYVDLRVDHGVTFDGGGSVIETAKVVLVPVERAGVIKAATLVADASGSITITITKYDPAADATTLGSAAAVGSIALATKIINRDTTLSGWTLAVAEGDILAFTTGGTIATVTRVTCKLKVELA